MTVRKIICFVLAGAVSAALSGCGGDTATVENTDVTIVKIMKPGNIRDFYDVLSEFSEVNPDIRVKFVDAPSGTLERHGLYVSAMSGRDSSVDIYWLNDEWIDEFARYGYIKPFDTEFGITHDQHIIDTKKCFEYGNRLYAMPIGVDTDILYYRNDMLSSPPSDWNQLAEVNGGNMCIDGSDGADMIYNIIRIKHNSGLDYGSVLKMYKELFSGLNGEGEDAASAFRTGNTPVFFGKVSDYGEMNSSASAIKGRFSVSLIPGNSTDGHFIRGYGLGINANSENPEEALEVLNYLKTKDVQRLLARSCSLMPVIRELYDDEMVLYDNAHFAQLKEVVEKAEYYSTLGVDNGRLVRLDDALNMYLRGDTDEAAAGAVFEEELN